MAAEIRLPAHTVDQTSRRWEEEHEDLLLAGRTLQDAPVAGFTAPVAETAGRFTAAWRSLAEAVGSDCRASADRLRRAAQGARAADEAVADSLRQGTPGPTGPGAR